MTLTEANGEEPKEEAKAMAAWEAEQAADPADTNLSLASKTAKLRRWRR